MIYCFVAPIRSVVNLLIISIIIAYTLKPLRNYLSKMTTNQAILLKNSNVLNKDIRKLHNTGEKFLKTIM